MAEPVEGGVPPPQGVEGQTPGQSTSSGPAGQDRDQWTVDTYKHRAEQVEVLKDAKSPIS